MPGAGRYFTFRPGNCNTASPYRHAHRENVTLPRSNTDRPSIHWTEAGENHVALWQSEAGLVPPKRVQVADDTLSADTAYRLACEGTALLWRGDFQNARQLLQAMARRVDRKPRKPAPDIPGAFHQQRMAQAQRARTLGMLLIPFSAGHVIPLRRAPDVQQACEEAHGPTTIPYVASLRELLGLIGAHEWRKNGIDIPACGGRIHPHYGVFAPIRSEYVGLVANTPLPTGMAKHSLAFDIGTGTGVLAAVLAKRGVGKILATDQDARALACARENLVRLGVGKQVEILQADLFPPGRAPLIVCNPPWVPARPSSQLEHAIYDPDSRMLRGFLNGLAEHLAQDGEGWLILSDLAEHLGLRARSELLTLIEGAGLQVLGRIDVKPTHPRAADPADPLHAARAAEVTSLWRIGMRG
jgi:methylase of polypeptide subunit release factors